MHIRSFLERTAMLRGGETPSASTSGAEPPRLESSDKTFHREWFSGNTIAMEVLPTLGVTFDELRGLYNERHKPVLDLGASYSTVALEGAFRGIPIHSTDLRCDSNRHGFIENIRHAATNLGALYNCPELFPNGFFCTRISTTEWQSCLEHGLAQISSRMAQCSASNILLPSGERAPDRHFSVVISHNAVPLYSNTLEFMSSELPEILRVTDRRVALFPFCLPSTTTEAHHLSENNLRQAVEDVARRLGFSVSIAPSPAKTFSQNSRVSGLDGPQLAVFTRER